MIELIEVNKRYPESSGGAFAVRDCSLSIKSGEFVAIVGTSGSGKTSLLNLIGCLDHEFTGSITFDGHALSELSDDELSAIRNRDIGFVFQEFHLLDHLSVRENIILPLSFAKPPIAVDESHLDQLAEQLDITDKMSRHPVHLSGGQRQRVAIARALIRAPKCLLCDEPTGSLDSETGAKLLAMLNTLNTEGYTIVMITHDPKVAATADRIVRIEDGRVQEEFGSK